MKQNQNCRGLREEIAQASSLDEIKTLLALGAEFNSAALRTQRAWKATAARRTAHLRGAR